MVLCVNVIAVRSVVCLMCNVYVSFVFLSVIPSVNILRPVIMYHLSENSLRLMFIVETPFRRKIKFYLILSYLIFVIVLHVDPYMSEGLFSIHHKWNLGGQASPGASIPVRKQNN